MRARWKNKSKEKGTRPLFYFLVILRGPVRSGLADGYCVTRVAYILILYSLPILFTIFFFLTRCEIPSATHAFDLYSSDIQEMWRVVGGREKKSMKMPPIPDESWISHSVFLLLSLFISF